MVEWGDVEKVKVKYFWHDNRDSYSWLFSTIFAVIIEVSPQHRDNNFAVEDRWIGEPRSCWPACIALCESCENGFEVVNFDKLILHQFTTKISQIFNDGVKTSKFLKK